MVVFQKTSGTLPNFFKFCLIMLISLNMNYGKKLNFFKERVVNKSLLYQQNEKSPHIHRCLLLRTYDT